MSIQDVGIIATALIGITALIVSLLPYVTYNRSEKERRYEYIDHQYFRILQTGMLYPKFREAKVANHYDEKGVLTEEELQKYECYAFNVWNLCETIVDRANTTDLLETWFPVIVTENKLHRKWFDNNTLIDGQRNGSYNKEKFKEKFTQYINENKSL